MPPVNPFRHSGVDVLHSRKVAFAHLLGQWENESRYAANGRVKQNFLPMDSSEREIFAYRLIFSGYSSMLDEQNPMLKKSWSANDMANTSG